MVCSNIVVLELYQDTPKVNKGDILLIAGSKAIDNIGRGESLHMKTDNNTYSFVSHDVVTEHDSTDYGYGATTPFSHKTYVVPEWIIREIASSTKFLVKINLLNNEYIEGKCTPLSLKEVQEQNAGLDIKQEHVDSTNKFVAINGFPYMPRCHDG